MVYYPSMMKHKFFTTPQPFGPCLDAMRAHVAGCAKEQQDEEIWWLEHQPVITAGTSAKVEDLLDQGELPVFDAGRGGQYTVHNLGQRVIYPIVKTVRFKDDVRLYLRHLEEWILAALKDVGISGKVIPGRTGVWVGHHQSEKKIAALGIRVSKRIFHHGMAINICNDLSDFQRIVPCGIEDRGVTSLHEQGVMISMKAFDDILMRHLPTAFTQIP